MDKRLFIGGLPFSINDQSLAEIFSKFGTVESASVIIDRMTGQSKGFGFVEMSSVEEAQAAIKALNETELEGRKITVNIARPKEERPQGDFGGGRGGYQQRSNNNYSRGGNSNRGGGNRW
ncbi:MAG: RNA recognition motif domain-containing protein [Microgenomates group bacterium]